jgi:hypothetical protein
MMCSKYMMGMVVVVCLNHQPVLMAEESASADAFQNELMSSNKDLTPPGLAGKPADASAAAPVSRVWPDNAPVDCPFPKSSEFSGIEFTGRHAEYTQADTWYPSWASDGNLYSPYTDGTADPLPKCVSAAPIYNTGCARIEGDNPLALKVIPLGIRKVPGAPYKGRYPCGTLVYNGLWYYGSYAVATHKYPYDILGPFVGFDISRDFGKTWEKTPFTSKRPLFGEAYEPFVSYVSTNKDPVLNMRAATDAQVVAIPKVKMGTPHFVDFGKNMEHSPDGKAYLVAHGATRPQACNSWVSGDQVYLARVKPSPETINNIGCYEFFAGCDASGLPLWTNSFSAIKPLLEWNDRLGCVTVTWNPVLRRFFMCIIDGGNSGMDDFNTMIMEAETLTGPWRRVVLMEKFGDQAYFANFPSKFIGGDGRTMWLSYSANYAPKNKRAANPAGSSYRMCLQEVRLVKPETAR